MSNVDGISSSSNVDYIQLKKKLEAELAKAHQQPPVSNSVWDPSQNTSNDKKKLQENSVFG